MEFGYTWRLITEGTGMVVHTGIASDLDGVAEQLAIAVRRTPRELLVTSMMQRGLLLQIDPYKHVG